MELEKNYNFLGIEEKWYEFWLKSDYFKPGNAKPKNASKNEHFSIVIPPPNVTGSLHMGHALDNTIQDISIRFNRMRIGNTLWVPGTDHGGIATQNVVEKLLKAEGLTRHILGREKFLERMWKWRNDTGDSILFQLRKLGCSCDWSKTRFTMDEVCSSAVYNAFKILYDKGLIYRGVRMVNWCPRCNTALADIEVEHEQENGKLYHIKYPIAGDEFVIVATTRPETMLGDTAVAVNPKDKRYTKLVHKKIKLPLMDRDIPIVADDAVDLTFGTGAVKVTPAHDPTDAEIGIRHKLEAPIVIDFHGKITEAGGIYKGMDRYDARKKIIEDLEKLGLLVKMEDYTHAVGKCYRCNNTIEPLNSKQWFLNIADMRQKSMEAVNSKKIQFFPSSWEKPYMTWMENLKDWCISRQIWWGHRIPIWYCENDGCKPIVSNVKPDKCPACGSQNLVQDPDVLDTWFSSALWPFSVFGWPNETEDLKKFYPTTVLCCGYEILYLWVARMIMMGITLKGEVPFKHVNIHGIVRDTKGKKMSKSLGNVIDPLDLIKKYGTDSLRFIVAQSGIMGRDMQLGEENFLFGRNFTNKIWNVARYVMMNIDSVKGDIQADVNKLSVFDRWILSEYQKVAREVTESLAKYDVAVAARKIYEFVWFTYCDWYTEISKTGLKDASQKETTMAVLLFILEGVLRIAHSIMPFITEEIYQKFKELFKDKKIVIGNSSADFSSQSIMVADWPEPDFGAEFFDAITQAKVSMFIELVTALRNMRAEMKISYDKRIQVFLKLADVSMKEFILSLKGTLELMVKVENITAGTDVLKPANSASIALSNGVSAFVPLEGIIDFEKERLRLEKEITKINEDILGLDKKLMNEMFTTKAPQAEVQKVRERKKSFMEKRDNLEKYLKIIGE